MLPTTLALLLTAGPGIDPAKPDPWAWTSRPEVALALAEERDVPVFLALHHEGELRSEELLEEIYPSKALAAFHPRTVNLVGSDSIHADEGEPCPRFPGLECSDHHEVLDWAVGTLDLGLEPRLPHHLWLRPSGQVLISVPFEMQEAELAWCFARALLLVRRDDSLQPKEARPPRRLVLGRPYRPDPSLPFARGLTMEELEERVARLRGSSRPAPDRTDAGIELLFAHHEDAAEQVRQGLGRGILVWNGTSSLETFLQVIGRISSPRFADLLVRYTRDPRPEVRNQTAVALEQIGPASAAKAVRSALSKEKLPHIEKNWIRALGATGHADRSSSKELRRIAEREKDDLLRRNALFALGYLPAEGKVFEVLVEALTNETPGDRQAAAFGMALSRDGRYVEPLREALRTSPGELDEGTRAGIRRSLGVLQGAPLQTIEESVRALLQDGLPRDRVFFQPGGEERAGERRERRPPTRRRGAGGRDG